ncbi:hypothetical protein EDB83DRAFT_1012249 [Lactarius deliciosus]|nr:hypothetical protein EDB83DRAFT_1012249 [Lactarius deliciosus]
MPWPAHIVAKSSRLLDTETIENKFYGLYNTILSECFPSTQFTVTPQYATAGAQTGGPGPIDFVIAYVIESLDLDSPVFFVEIKPPTHLPSLSARPKTKFEPGSGNLPISSEYRSCTESALSEDNSPTTHTKEPAVPLSLLPWRIPPFPLWTLPLFGGGTRISCKRRAVPSSWRW